ncbi:MAG: hypothetical protein N3A53_02570, partial [Verrucomicrobiae bacterium]|nr:hypothetical protein [Verrucomicrobiae bacterium]
MFQWLTGSLFRGFAGSLIIGGLYWRRGTTAAAYAAMGVGVSWALFAFFLTQCWASHVYPWLSVHAPGVLTALTHGLETLGARLAIANWKVTPERCPISGMELHALNIIWCITTYVVVSVLTCRQPFNLERMLHRGIYARAEDRVEGDLATPRRWWQKLVGIDREYTRGDRILAWSVFVWTMIGFGYFAVSALWNIFLSRWSDETWFAIWKYYGMSTSLLIGAVTPVWFTWGSTRDLVRFFRALREVKRSVSDDGRVVGHVSADDVALVEKVEHAVLPEGHRGAPGTSVAAEVDRQAKC